MHANVQDVFLRHPVFKGQVASFT